MCANHEPVAVGFLTPKLRVACPECANVEAMVPVTPVFRVNIEPYKQSCCACGKIVVEGRTPKWPELYTGV